MVILVKRFYHSLNTKIMDSNFMTREKWIEVARIVANAIVAIIAALTVTNCTATMSISKYNTSSPQQIEQVTNVDSTKFNLNLK